MMPGHNRDHYSGDYPARARRVRQAAAANPATRCWRCDRTLDQHPPGPGGRPPRWTAGHTIDGDSSAPLAPEVDTCNFAAGARLRNTGRTPGRDVASRAW